MAIRNHPINGKSVNSDIAAGKTGLLAGKAVRESMQIAGKTGTPQVVKHEVPKRASGKVLRKMSIPSAQRLQSR
jgi:hypothetical protein